MEIDELNVNMSGDCALSPLNPHTFTLDSIKKQLFECRDPEQIQQLILKILQSNIFVFSEILDIPNIESLKNGPLSLSYDVLELFAYGSYKDYIGNIEKFPKLNTYHIKKLRILTVISLTYTYKNVPYAVLLRELDIETIRELEDLLIEIIYANLIKGKLNQNSQLFCVEYAIGRDIRKESLSDLIVNLEKWYENNEKLLGLIENEISLANNKKKENCDLSDKYQENIESLKRIIKSNVNPINGVQGSHAHNHTSHHSSNAFFRHQNYQHENTPSPTSANYSHSNSNLNKKLSNVNNSDVIGMEEEEDLLALSPEVSQAPSTSQIPTTALGQIAAGTQVTNQKQVLGMTSNITSSKKQTKAKSGLRGSAAKLFHKQ